MGARALAPLLAQRGIFATRIPEDNLLLSPWLQPPGRVKFYRSVVRYARMSRPVYASHGVHAPSTFIGLGTMGTEFSLHRIVARLLHLKSNRTVFQTVELMVHPGYLVSQDTPASPDWPMDDGFSSDVGRVHELRVLKSEVFQSTIRE